uniref:5-hmdU DNA kinase helical domain-containing protein n=1 Tax=Ditylum brightwellii TaxID=49249 RepID=A0A6V2BKJ6_9STRA
MAKEQQQPLKYSHQTKTPVAIQHESKPSTQMMPHATPFAFLQFMKKRWQIRINHLKNNAEPTKDEILKTFHFTNVKREHDRTTKWMRQRWTTSCNENHSTDGEIIFNCGLFRLFGTIEMAQGIQAQLGTAKGGGGWIRLQDLCQLGGASNDEIVLENTLVELVVAAAIQTRKDHGHAFTKAYCLPNYNAEVKTAQSAEDHYRRIAKGAVLSLWRKRDIIAQACRDTKKWEKAAAVLSKVKGFGGTGFFTKEVLLDVMQTQVLCDCVDRNLWTGIGPGAQRGLDRIYRQDDAKARKKVTGVGAKVGFLRSCILLFEFCWSKDPQWCTEVDLELSDVQFQLCEFDKYERIRKKEGGRKRRYVPRCSVIPASNQMSTHISTESDKIDCAIKKET